MKITKELDPVSNELLDKLSLEMLSLIEQQVACKLHIENATVEGQLLMAKSRYIQGRNSVSQAQLPTENSADFQALTTTASEKGADNMVRLEVITKPVDKEAGLIDPAHWFGILVPASLQQAKQKFQKSIELTVECSNIQIDLFHTIVNIIKLKF